jgi:hypothetical protein
VRIPEALRVDSESLRESRDLRHSSQSFLRPDALLRLVITIPAHAASEMACMVMWDKADVNKNGTLEGDGATAYLDAIRKSGKKYKLKTVDQRLSFAFSA